MTTHSPRAEEPSPAREVGPPREHPVRGFLEGQHGRRVDHDLQQDDMDREVEQRVSGQGDQRRRHDEGDVDHEQILETQPQVLEELTALADRPHDGAEVVIQQDDRRDLACAPRAPLAHRDADVGCLERGYVVDPIPRDRDDLAAFLQALHQHELLGRFRAGDDVHTEKFVPLLVGDEAFQLFSRDQTGSLAADANALRDGKGRQRMIAGDHDGVDPGGIAVPDRLPDSFADRVLERQHSCELEARVRFMVGSR